MLGGLVHCFCATRCVLVPGEAGRLPLDCRTCWTPMATELDATGGSCRLEPQAVSARTAKVAASDKLNCFRRRARRRRGNFMSAPGEGSPLTVTRAVPNGSSNEIKGLRASQAQHVSANTDSRRP